jgi:hypothetical protein
MKSTTLSSRIALVVLVIFAACVPSFALPTGSLALSGLVTTTVDVTVTAETGTLAATALPILLGATHYKIATINEKSNSKTGYTLSVGSTNGFTLKSTGTDAVAYTLTYGTTDFTSLSGAVILTTSLAAKTALAGVSKELFITFPATTATLLTADTYGDTLTFTIAAQ